MDARHRGHGRVGAAGADGQRVWALLVGGSVAFTLVSIMWELKLWDSPWLLTFQLGTELNLATWWSGMMPLLAALVAYEHASHAKDRVRVGWMALAATFAVMSLTEIGSIHERLDDALTLLFILLLASLFLLAVTRLWPQQELRSVVLITVVAMGLLAITTLQEHAKGFGTFLDDIPLMSVALEEMVEVLAYMFMLVAATVGRPAADRGATDHSLLPAPHRLAGAFRLVLALAAVHLAVALFLMPGIDIGQQGDPAVWFPAAAFLGLFLVHWQAHRSATGGSLELWRALWALGMSALMVSAVSPASVERFSTYDLPVDARILVGVLLLATLGVCWFPTTPISPWVILAAVAMVAGVAVEMVAGITTLRYVLVGIVPAVPLLFQLTRSDPPRWDSTGARLPTDTAQGLGFHSQ